MNEQERLHKKKDGQSSASVARLKNNALALQDNRPGAVLQKKEAVIQLGKKDKEKKKDGYEADDDEDYIEPSKKRKHRSTFSKEIRKEVIKKTALKNKTGHYVCPGCGMPLADKNLKEFKTYYISKEKEKRHDIVSTQLDHYPPWSKRLEKLQKEKKSEEEIREDHDDITRLRALCLRCNQSHKYENKKELPKEGYTDEEYYSADSERDKEIWKKKRKFDDDDKDDNTGVV